MAKVGTIAIDLVASTGKLSAPFAKAGQDVKKFSSGVTASMARASAAVRSFGAGLKGRLTMGLGSAIGSVAALTGGALSLYTAFGKVKEQFAAVDSISKSAARLGLTTEQFIGLQHGADLAGIEVEALTKAMQKLRVHKTIEIAPNVAAAQGAVGKLNKNRMFEIPLGDTQKAMELVADTLAAMANNGDRLRYAISLFGKDGAQMVDFLKDGAAGLREAQADAQKLGLAISGVSAIKIEMANDAVTRLNDMVTGVARKIAIELAPFIKVAADNFTAWGTEGEGVSGKVRAGIDLVIDGMSLVLDVVDAARTAWFALQVGTQGALSLITTGVGYLVKGVELATEGIVFGFKWAFARVTQFVQEAVGGMISILANVADWIETKLPERFRLGIGAAAQEFSKQFDGVVAENRKAMESNSFAVDFKFGDTAQEFAKTLQQDTQRAFQDFDAFKNREKMSDKLKRTVEKARDEVQKAAGWAAFLKPPTVHEQQTARVETRTPEAIERGSVQAFSAFHQNLAGQQGADKDRREKQQAENIAGIKRMMERNAIAFAIPNF